MLKFTQFFLAFKKFLEKSTFLKSTTQVFEAGDFLKIS